MNRSVMFVILTIIILSGAYLLYKIFSNDCVSPVISYFPSNPKKGDEVIFSCNNITDKNIYWNFGDKELTGNPLKHIFNSPGKFFVKTFTDDECSIQTEVIVSDINTVTSVIPEIKIVPDIKDFYPGQKVTFFCDTSNTTEFAWLIKETKESFNTNSFNYTFPKPGIYTINLNIKGNKLNGENTTRIEVKSIAIVPKDEMADIPAPIPPPVKKTEPPVKYDPQIFINEFMEIVNNIHKERDAQIRWKNLFDKHDCYPIKNPMQVKICDLNNKEIRTETIYNFHTAMLNDQYEVKEVEILNPKMKCISQIIVKAEVK